MFNEEIDFTPLFIKYGIKKMPNSSNFGICRHPEFTNNVLACNLECKDIFNGCSKCEHFEVEMHYPHLYKGEFLLDLLRLIVSQKDFKLNKEQSVSEQIINEIVSGDYDEREVLRLVCSHTWS